MSQLRTLLAVTAFCSLTIYGLAEDKRISRSELPAEVEKTVQAQTAGATIKGVTTERENGRTIFEVEMVVNSHGKDVSIAGDGSVVEVEEEISFASLPKPVQDGLMSRAHGATITKVESLRKPDRLVAYEAVVVKAGKHREIQVGPQGEQLAHEE